MYNLGFIFDKCIKMSQKYVTVVHAYVTSHIDYCNSLLYDISDYNINHL